MQVSSGAGSEVHATGERSGHGRLGWSEIHGTGERSGNGRLGWLKIHGTDEGSGNGRLGWSKVHGTDEGSGNGRLGWSKIHGTGERSGHGRLGWSKIDGTGERSGHGRLGWSEDRREVGLGSRQAVVVGDPWNRREVGTRQERIVGDRRRVEDYLFCFFLAIPLIHHHDHPPPVPGSCLHSLSVTGLHSVSSPEFRSVFALCPMSASRRNVPSRTTTREILILAQIAGSAGYPAIGIAQI